jgi:DNA modification methylase
MDVRDYGGVDLTVSKLAQFILIWKKYCVLQVVNLGIIRRKNSIVRYWDDYIQAAEDAGLMLLSWNVWDRLHAWSLAQQTAIFPIEHEWVFIFGEKRIEIKRTIENIGAGELDSGSNREINGVMMPVRHYRIHDKRKLGTVYRGGMPYIGRDTGHPAVFPVDLPEAYIRACTKSGGKIADCFIGSGSTMIAAEQTGRICYGMEIEPKYCAITLDRMSAMGLKMRLIHGK